MPNHTVLQVLEDVNVFTDDAADKDCTIPFEAVMDCLGWEEVYKLDIL